MMLLNCHKNSGKKNQEEYVVQMDAYIHDIVQDQIIMDDQCISTLYKRGQQLILMKEYEKAFIYFNQALLMNPNDFLCQCQKGLKYYHYEGQILLQQKQFQEALLLFDSALTHKPEHTKLLYLKYKCLLKMDQKIEAIQFSQQKIELLCKRYQQSSQSGYKLILVKWLDKIIPTRPNDYKIIFYKVQTLMELKKFQDAIECANIILSINPQHYQTLAQKGQSLMKLGQFNEAMQYIEKAFNINQKDQRLILLKGRCLRSVFNLKEAIKWLALVQNNQLAKDLIDQCKCLL